MNAQSGHARLSRVTIGPCYPGVELTYLRFDYGNKFSEHGTLRRNAKTKYVDIDVTNPKTLTEVRIHTSKVSIGLKWKTRIVGMSFKVGSGLTIVCGTQDPHKAEIVWTKDTQNRFLYFSGRQGAAIDELTAHMIPITDY